MKNLLFIILFTYIYSQVPAQSLIPDSLKNTKIEALINDIVEQKMDSIKKIPIPKRPVFPFKVKLAMNGNWAEGNVRRELLRLIGDFSFKKDRSLLEFYINPRYTYGTQNKILREDEFVTRAGLNIFHNNRVYILSFGAVQVSHLRRIRLRSEAGLGLGFRFFRKAANTKFSITNVLIYENTDFIDVEDNDIETLSFSMRLKGSYKLLKNHLKITHTFFIQPSLLRNYFRFIGNLQFAYKITNRLDFNLVFRDTYESIVANNRVNNDFNILIGLSFYPLKR